MLTSDTAGYACAVMIYFFVVSFAYSWGPVVWALCTELFPTAQRAKGVALTTTTNWLFTLIVGQFVPVLLDDINFGVFLFFAACCAVMVVFVYLMVPETKGLSIDQMAALFDRKDDGYGASAPGDPSRDYSNAFTDSSGVGKPFISRWNRRS